jgi:uncharacterized protein YaeQ
MALKSTVFKAQLQIADMDRALYADHALTLARHPSENDERMMIRLLAFALSVPADNHRGALEFTAGLSDTEAPDIWQKDLTGDLLQWIEIGQPDDRRLAKACGRSEAVSVWTFNNATPIWWAALTGKVNRLANLTVWQIPVEASKELALLAERSMQLQVTVQEGQVWVGNASRSVALEPKLLKAATPRR